jgi:hypothetical protein
MNTLERELIDRISRLDEDNQRRVLDFVRSIETAPQARAYSALELMKLPYEERTRLAIEALERSADEDVEVFEAYDDDENYDEAP